MEVTGTLLAASKSFSFASRARGGSLLCYIGTRPQRAELLCDKQLLIKKLAPNE